MPDFGNPFSGLANDRKLTQEELIREIRFMVSAEYEAIQLYMQLAESTDNQLAIQVLTEIADEERVHAGEFMRLLFELAPDEKEFYAEGTKEVEEKIADQKKWLEAAWTLTCPIFSGAGFFKYFYDWKKNIEKELRKY